MPKSPHKKYTIIYADPPWSYNNKTIRGGAANHYSTMSTKEICALPIERIRADNSALFLWSTQPNLPAALQVVEAWGYRYVNVAFTWAKLTKGWRSRLWQLNPEKADSDCESYQLGAVNSLFFMGTGFYTRGNPEICLLGLRGSMKPVDNSVRQLVVSPVTEHSEKPDKVRQSIEKLYGRQQSIELFARKEFAGWDCWGAECANVPDWAADG